MQMQARLDEKDNESLFAEEIKSLITQAGEIDVEKLEASLKIINGRSQVENLMRPSTDLLQGFATLTLRLKNEKANAAAFKAEAKVIQEKLGGAMKALLHARLHGLQHALEPFWVIGQVVFANGSTSEEECKVFQEALSCIYLTQYPVFAPFKIAQNLCPCT